MTDNGRGPPGYAMDAGAHAYDPVLTEPELFEDVLARRVLAFLIDMVDHHHSR